jgi:hypothetical protein
MPQRFLETPDTPPRIQNNRRNPRIIVDDDENELIDNFILENRNNNLLNDPQIEVIRLPMNINENPMYNYVAPNPWRNNALLVAPNPWRNNALLAVNNLLNPPVNIIPPIVILSTEEKNVKRMQLKAALNEAASGLVPEIDLIDQPSIRNAMNEFVSKSHSKRLHICAICHERWFQDNTIIMNNNQYYCNRCLKDDKSNHTPDIPFVHSFGDLNDMNPFYHPNPLAISELKRMEELYSLTPVEHSLIARHTLVSQTYRLKGPRHGQNYMLSYDSVSNHKQYVSITIVYS